MGQILILLVGCIGAHHCFYTPSPITLKQMLLMGFPQPKTETPHLKMTNYSHSLKTETTLLEVISRKRSQILKTISHFYLLFSCPIAKFVGNYWGDNLPYQMIITVFLAVFKLKVTSFLWVASHHALTQASPSTTTTITRFWRALLWGHSPMFSTPVRNPAASLGVLLKGNMKIIISTPRLKFWNQILLQIRKIHVRIFNFQQIKRTVIQVFFQ